VTKSPVRHKLYRVLLTTFSPPGPAQWQQSPGYPFAFNPPPPSFLRFGDGIRDDVGGVRTPWLRPSCLTNCHA